MTEPSPPRPLRYGEPLALVHAASNRNPRFALGSLGGRFILFCVIGDVRSDAAKAALAAIPADTFNEGPRICAVFCADPHGAEADLATLAPTTLVFHDAEAARQCGLIDPSAPEGRCVLLDPTLRGLAFWPLAEANAALAALKATPDPNLHAGAPLNAPVLITPRVFEPDFCALLIAHYQRHGGAPSGVTVEANGKTVVNLDDGFKRRSDCLIEDEKLRSAIMHRMYWRLAPEIAKAFAWRPTRMERYLIARYDEEAGFFKPHRDNTTKGTAHRRFAVTINLNADEYEGGDLRFPEFGSRTYRAPTGGAVVFSCSLLHEATPVTRGARYAFLPFLYDDAAAKVRLENNKHLDDSIGPYKGG